MDKITKEIYVIGKDETIEIHPAADRMPMLREKEFKLLVKDIQANGQKEPIVIYEEKVLDGRNRLKACRELGLDIRAIKLDEEIDPVEYVRILNLRRRQLRPAQLATIAVNDMETRPSPVRGKLRDIVAKEYGISPRMVQAAKQLKEKRLDLFEKAFNGEKKNLAIPIEDAEKKSAPSLSEHDFIIKLLKLFPYEMKDILDAFREGLSGEQRKIVDERVRELRQERIRDTIKGFRPLAINQEKESA